MAIQYVQRIQGAAIVRVVTPSTPVEEKSGSNFPWVELLLAAGTGYVTYQVGKQGGYNQGHAAGYKEGQATSALALQQAQQQLRMSQNEASALRQQVGRLQTEKELLVGLVKQQPTTPQVEAILKVVQRVELRLTEVLPPQFDSGQYPSPN